ncbi:hypothetical protein MtrunA17_Chr6g0470111 [Medicago truncatula]|uniref:Tic22 family protein n=1 Tax=Medicago truncatula TaxID=3880 RepID=A0A072U997_MEDTR|nr:uncharacterized protein LOC25496505 [Medicago truncatula]KEH26364.1 Tic22 family protein [Medicago truncatula]RHN51568.1 hypothetical protein MtrunA17_Chr6g0470111 [Medicago truncatula]
MAQPSSPHRRRNHHNHLSTFLHSTASNFISLFNPHPPPPLPSSTPQLPSAISLPLFLPPPLSTVTLSSTTESTRSSPKSVRVSRLNGKNITGGSGGPAFVGQVFSMCDLSGTGLMAVSTHFDIPFITKRTPEWLKKMFAAITKSERNGPVFRFFIDLGDAVSYVKKLNIPSGVVGACRLDLAYEHFKEKPHLFQFVPNEKQVKAANKLLKTIPHSGFGKKVDGVPVFSAHNLDIAIATTDGIKWYTPYFFDKNMLDNILEEAVDQHFHTLIQTRHIQRRRDVVDDNLAAEVVEEIGDSLGEPPEVQEVLDEMGHPSIPLSVISKAAELQFHYTVDKVLLGNRWLRKATGIQPKFPYMVDSFERRSEASFLRITESSSCPKETGCTDSSEYNLDDITEASTKHSHEKAGLSRKGVNKEDLKQNTFLPKITMVGLSTEEAGQMSKASLKKTMDDLTKELEKTEADNVTVGGSNEYKLEDRDPLFVANVGDYYSSVGRTGSPRWIRGGSN